jgi:hypothetical protein
MALPMKTNYVLIDFESVHVKSLALLTGEHFRVRLFLGPNHLKVPRNVVVAMQELGERGKYVELDTPGPNALDFHIAYYLGTLASADPAGFFHIISKDTGFDPLIAHLKAKHNIFAARSESIEEMPCFRASPVAAPAPKETSARQSASNGSDVAAFVKLAVADLIKRKAAKPRRVATLRNTVLSRIGKDAASHLDAVIANLVRTGYVIIDGDKVTYALPS